jgi:hypothetical protein
MKPDRNGPIVPVILELTSQSGQSGERPLKAGVIDSGVADNRISNTAKAQAVYRARRTRERAFGDSADLFGEPAWDILLDLYVARQIGVMVSVGSASIASGAPSTTGLRWVNVLVAKGFIDRVHDSEDRRRSLVQISDQAMEIMERWLETI